MKKTIEWTLTISVGTVCVYFIKTWEYTFLGCIKLIVSAVFLVPSTNFVRKAIKIILK